MAAWVPGMLNNFYLGKNHKIAKNSTTTKARGKISTALEIGILDFFVCFTKFKTNQILLKISHIFLLTTFQVLHSREGS